MTSTSDWGDIIDEAEVRRFVGREQELDTFRQQIGLSKPNYLIFCVTGQGGVGKTTLLNRYTDIRPPLPHDGKRSRGSVNCCGYY